jgi:hypothetical protein
MRFIVVRPVPFRKAQQRRRCRRPDSFDVRQIEHAMNDQGTRSNGARWNRTKGLLMNDEQLHQEPDGTGRTAQVALFQSAVTSQGFGRNETIACRQPSKLRCAGGSHDQYVDAYTDWTLRRIDELVTEGQHLPLVVPLTVTFAPNSTRPDRVLAEYERFYARFCRLLINNPERASKRHLLPFAIAFRDDPSTRPNKHRDRPSASAIFSNHPSVAPHVHSLIVIHPRLTDRFLTIVDTLQETWRRIPVQASDATSSVVHCLSRPTDRAVYANRTLYADVPFALRFRKLMTHDFAGNRSLIRAQTRNVIDYSAKLGRRPVAGDVDLFTVLPPASNHAYAGWCTN